MYICIAAASPLRMINCINDDCLRIVDGRVLPSNVDITVKEYRTAHISLESITQTKQKHDSLKMTFFFVLIRPRNNNNDDDDDNQNYSLERLISNKIELKISFFCSGVFLFLPIAVNLFLIQHKESKRYLCGENNQLFGLVSEQE
jgi:hypothetical protein